MGQQVGGKILYGSTLPDGGGGIVAGARDGLSLDTADFAVLGNLTTDMTNPAILTDNRRIPMAGFLLEFEYASNLADNLTINGPDARLNFVAAEPQNWEIWQPSNYGVNYSPGGTANRWYCGYDLFAGVNPDSPRPNVVGHWWAYNTEFSAGRADTTEAAFRYATETFFEIDDDFYFEFHTPEITTDAGDIFRLDSTYVSRTTGVGFREIVMNDTSWYDTTHDPATGFFFYDLSYTVSSDITRLTLRSQLTGGVTEIIMGNWTDGNATIAFQGGLFFIDSASQIELTSNTLIFNPSNYSNMLLQTVFSDMGENSPDGNAVIDAQSVTRGIMFPRLTTAQRLAISFAGSTTGGLVVYDLDIKKYYGTTGNAPTIVWEQIQSL